MMAHCSRSVARTAVFLAVLAVVSMLLPITVRANGADIYKKIKPSLALVIVPQADGRQVAFGTAFCVASSADSSTFLTSRHVIEGGTRYFLLLQGNNTPIEATILRKGEGDNDVAALTVHRGGFMPLALDGDLPAEGTTIAIAGYPATQLELARAHLGLAPSVHEGTVSAIVAQGFFNFARCAAGARQQRGAAFRRKHRSGLRYRNRKLQAARHNRDKRRDFHTRRAGIHGQHSGAYGAWKPHRINGLRSHKRSVRSRNAGLRKSGGRLGYKFPKSDRNRNVVGSADHESLEPGISATDTRPEW